MSEDTNTTDTFSEYLEQLGVIVLPLEDAPIWVLSDYTEDEAE